MRLRTPLIVGLALTLALIATPALAQFYEQHNLVSDGTAQPWRVRVRPPSLINLQALRKLCIGHLVADVVAIIGTLDIVLGEIDR